MQRSYQGTQLTKVCDEAETRSEEKGRVKSRKKKCKEANDEGTRECPHLDEDTGRDKKLKRKHKKIPAEKDSQVQRMLAAEIVTGVAKKKRKHKAKRQRIQNEADGGAEGCLDEKTCETKPKKRKKKFQEMVDTGKPSQDDDYTALLKDKKKKHKKQKQRELQCDSDGEATIIKRCHIVECNSYCWKARKRNTKEEKGSSCALVTATWPDCHLQPLPTDASPEDDGEVHVLSSGSREELLSGSYRERNTDTLFENFEMLMEVGAHMYKDSGSWECPEDVVKFYGMNRRENAVGSGGQRRPTSTDGAMSTQHARGSQEMAISSECSNQEMGGFPFNHPSQTLITDFFLDHSKHVRSLSDSRRIRSMSGIQALSPSISKVNVSMNRRQKNVIRSVDGTIRNCQNEKLIEPDEPTAGTAQLSRLASDVEVPQVQDESSPSGLADFENRDPVSKIPTDIYEPRGGLPAPISASSASSPAGINSLDDIGRRQTALNAAWNWLLESGITVDEILDLLRDVAAVEEEVAGIGDDEAGNDDLSLKE